MNWKERLAEAVFVAAGFSLEAMAADCLVKMLDHAKCWWATLLPIPVRDEDVVEQYSIGEDGLEDVVADPGSYE